MSTRQTSNHQAARPSGANATQKSVADTYLTDFAQRTALFLDACSIAATTMWNTSRKARRRC